MSEYPYPQVKHQAFDASTADGSVYVRVSGLGHVLGVQIEPEAMRLEPYMLAQRIVACADVAYLQSQVALVREMSAGGDPLLTEGMATDAQLRAAMTRLETIQGHR